MDRLEKICVLMACFAFLGSVGVAQTPHSTQDGPASQWANKPGRGSSNFIEKISDLPILNSSFAIEDLNRDGFNDILFVSCSGQCVYSIHGGSGVSTPDIPGDGDSGLYVHVLDGANNYRSELPRQWPRRISTSVSLGFHPTVAVGDINFDGRLDVLVGGLISNRSVFAFQDDGSDVPGFESVQSQAPPFFNAPVIFDVNSDGAQDALFADESTYLHRYNSQGVRRQCQFVGDPIYATPAVGDVGQPGLFVADGIPDEIAAAVPGQMSVYSSFGQDLNCSGYGDVILQCFLPPEFPLPIAAYCSSPAIADLDQDGTQDIVIHRTDFDPYGLRVGDILEVWASTQGEQVLRFPGENEFYAPAYSSVAIVDLDFDGRAQEIIFGTDAGDVVAARYQSRGEDPRLRELWRIRLDAGRSVSSSPVLADLTGDGRPEIVVGNNAGNVYVLSPEGRIIESFSCLDGHVWLSDAAILSTAAIGRRNAALDLGISSDKPMIVAGNRRGVFLIHLDRYPAFKIENATWPTFHKNNSRTGSLDFPVYPIRGSVGGSIRRCAERTFGDRQYVALLGSDGTIVEDYYGGPAITACVGDRFLFEMVPPGDYWIQILLNEPVSVPVHVDAGKMSVKDYECGG